MRLVKPERWAMWLDGTPMPKGATEDMLWAAYEAIRQMERRDEAVWGIGFFSELLAKDKEKLSNAQYFGTAEDYENLKDIVRIEEEIINTYRGWI